MIGYGKYYYCPQISILQGFQGINVNSDWGASDIPGYSVETSLIKSKMGQPLLLKLIQSMPQWM